MARTFGPRLGEILINRGVLTGVRLARALAEQQYLGGRLGRTLVACGYVSPDDLHAALTGQIKVQLDAGKFPSAWQTRPCAGLRRPRRITHDAGGLTSRDGEY